MTRVKNFILDILLNGVVLYGVYLMFLYAFFSLTPVSWYFTYYSVEPVLVPVEIGSDYILMESSLQVATDGNMYWNDVLRCRQNNGLYTFYSQYDTNAQVVYRGDTRTSQWEYRGQIPNQPSTCRMYSTITRKLPFGIEKQQTITSQQFDII